MTTIKIKPCYDSFNTEPEEIEVEVGASFARFKYLWPGAHGEREIEIKKQDLKAMLAFMDALEE